MTDTFFYFEDEQIPFKAPMSVAAALISAQQYEFRDSQVSQTPRGAFCMMGTCYECLVVIDGKPNQQACQVMATEQMRVARQPSTTTPEVNC